MLVNMVDMIYFVDSYESRQNHFNLNDNSNNSNMPGQYEQLNLDTSCNTRDESIISGLLKYTCK